MSRQCVRKGCHERVPQEFFCSAACQRLDVIEWHYGNDPRMHAFLPFWCEAEGCWNEIPEGRRRYCSDRCSKRERMRLYRLRRAARAMLAEG